MPVTFAGLFSLMDDVLYDKEMDGRTIAEIPQIFGAMVYGDNRIEATKNLLVLLLEMAENKEHD